MTIKFAQKRHSNSLNRILNFKLIVVFQMSRTFPLGQIVAAPYSEHGETQYYRARVDSYDQQKRQERRIDTATVSINENSECFSLLYYSFWYLSKTILWLQVFFVDFGNTETVDRATLRVCPPNIANIPFQVKGAIEWTVVLSFIDSLHWLQYILE